MKKKPEYFADVTLLRANLPVELLELNRWMGLRFIPQKNKWTKPPVNVHTMTVGKASNCEHWATFGNVADKLSPDVNVGFTLVIKGLSYIILDVDDCIIEGRIKDSVRRMIEFFNSYTEISASGTGIHIIIKTDSIESAHSYDNLDYEQLGIEIKNSWCCLTGDCIYSPRVITNATVQLNEAINRLEKTKKKKYTAIKPELYTLSYSDELVVKKIRDCKNKNACNLYDGYNLEQYAERSHGLDGADFALALHLIYWTNGNFNQVVRLMWNSALVRPKWNDYKDYVGDTVANAFEELNKKRSDANCTHTRPNYKH